MVIQGFLGKKIGMTQMFRPDGRAEAVTAVEAGPCVVTQIKTKDKDGYDAVQSVKIDDADVVIALNRAAEGDPSGGRNAAGDRD